MKKSIIGVIILVGLVMYGIYDHYNSRPEETYAESQVDLEGIELGIDKGQLAPAIIIQKGAVKTTVPFSF